MKAFEKWEDKKWQETGCGPLEPCGSCKLLREEGWKAALEWVLKEQETRGENYLKCVFDWIEQELET